MKWEYICRASTSPTNHRKKTMGIKKCGSTNLRKGCLTSSYCLKRSSGWWFQLFFIFTPKIGEDSHFDEHIFQRGWFNHQLVMGFPLQPWTPLIVAKPPSCLSDESNDSKGLVLPGKIGIFMGYVSFREGNHEFHLWCYILQLQHSAVTLLRTCEWRFQSFFLIPTDPNLCLISSRLRYDVGVQKETMHNIVWYIIYLYIYDNTTISVICYMCIKWYIYIYIPRVYPNYTDANLSGIGPWSEASIHARQSQRGGVDVADMSDNDDP